jgi:hypothetical protein
VDGMGSVKGERPGDQKTPEFGKVNQLESAPLFETYGLVRVIKGVSRGF